MDGRKASKAFALVTALASTQIGVASAQRGGDRSDSAPQTIVAFSDRCVQSNWPIEEASDSAAAAPLLAALGALLLPRLVDFGVSYVANRVREAGQRRETVIQASIDGYFAEADPLAPQYRIHRRMNCVIVAHGVMQDPAAPAAAGRVDAKFQNATYEGIGLRFAETPHLYFEGAIDWSDVGDSFRVIAAHVDMRKTVAAGVRGDGQARKLGLSLVFKDGAGTPFAEGAFGLEAVRFGRALNAGDLGLQLPATRGVPSEELAAIRKKATESARHSTGWMTALKPTPQEMQSLFEHCERVGCPNPRSISAGEDAAVEIEDKLLDGVLRAAPFSVTANVTETKDQQLLLLFLADGLELSKSAITPAVVGRVLRSSEINPYDPAWVAKRNAAQTACKALYEAVKATKTDFDTYKAANGGIEPAAELKNTAFEAKDNLAKARQAYADALIPEYLLAVDIASGCKLTAG